MDDGLNGYYVGTTENPTTFSMNLSSKEGYNNTLYYPHQEGVDVCVGYWLASPSADHVDSVMCVKYRGYVCFDYYNYSCLTFRPVVSLPSSILQ